MKAIKLADWQEKKKAEADKLTFTPCCVCGKAIGEGFYGRWSTGGTCSKTCEKVQETLPKYPDHPERSDHDSQDST